MGSANAQELRTLMGLAIKLRALAAESVDNSDVELFVAAALALEGRAHRLAFGTTSPEQVNLHKRMNIVC